MGQEVPKTTTITQVRHHEPSDCEEQGEIRGDLQTWLW